MKWHRMAGNGLIFLGGLALIGSAGAKFAQVPQVVSELNGEALSALLFLVAATRSLGLLLVSGLLGGAIATHMQHGQSYVGPTVLLVLIWLGASLRHPETLWSLTHPR